MFEFRHWLADRLFLMGCRFADVGAWFDKLSIKAVPVKKTVDRTTGATAKRRPF